MKNIFSTLKKFGCILLATMIPTFSFAADGTLGTDSTGTSTVTVTVPDLVRITNISNRTFGTWDGSSTLNSNDDVCIYTNKAAATYYVTATGDGAGSAFELASGGDTLAYEVFFNDVAGTTGEVQLTATTKSAQQTGANTTAQNCGGTDNANYHVRIQSTALLAAPSGAYSGVLTLLIEPN